MIWDVIWGQTNPFLQYTENPKDIRFGTQNLKVPYVLKNPGTGAETHKWNFFVPVLGGFCRIFCRRQIKGTVRPYTFKNVRPWVRIPPPTFRRHICQYSIPSSFRYRKGSVLHIETIWPAWIFELDLLKFSHFVSDSLRNLENDVQIFQFRLHELLNLPENGFLK